MSQLTGGDRGRREPSVIVAALAAVLALVVAACTPAAPTAAPAKPAAQPTTAPAKPAAAQPTAKPAAKPTATTATKPQPASLTGATALDPGSLSASAYWLVGKETGWFEEEGLSVQIDRVDTATSLTLLSQGSIDFFIGAPEAYLPVEARGQRTGVILAFKYFTRPWYWLAVQEGSPIRTVADLRGKTVGLSSLGAPQAPALELYLREAGLTLEDVTTVAVGNQASAAQALVSGEVDALQQVASRFRDFEVAGFSYHYFETPAEYDNLFGPVFYVNQQTLNDPVKVNALGRYFRVLSKSVIFMHNNPEATALLTWKQAPESKPTGISEDEALQNALLQLQVVIEHTGKPQNNDWGEFTADQVAAYVRFLGLQDQLTDPTALFTTAFVEPANQFDEAEVAQFAKNYEVD